MDITSAPLADYFWIAGIDSLSYSDPVGSSTNGRDKSSNGTGPPSPQVNTTIDEGNEYGEEGPPISPANAAPRASARHSRNNSWNRLSRLSNDARNSILSLDELEATRSNRSSLTIRAVPANGNGNGEFGDFDFDKALTKFANERESFLDDLSFSAGAPLQSRPPMTDPRADSLRLEGDVLGTVKRSPLRNVGGTIRRISFRDLNSLKRQPSTVQRTSEWDFYLRRDSMGFHMEVLVETTPAIIQTECGSFLKFYTDKYLLQHPHRRRDA